MDNNSAAKGCGFLLLGIFIIGLAIWALAILLWVLGLLLAIGGVVAAVWISVAWWRRISRAKEIKGIDAEVQEMARECYAELSDLRLELWAIESTKGIGTNLEESMTMSNRAMAPLIEQCDAAMRLCSSAPATPQRLQAIAHAQQTLYDIRSQLN